MFCNIFGLLSKALSVRNLSLRRQLYDSPSNDNEFINKTIPKIKNMTLNAFQGCALQATTLFNDDNRLRAMECMKKTTISRRKSNGKHASVLIAICLNSENMDELSILFTKRSATLNRHGFEVSFPGGIRDDVDSGAIDCALRECEEEIGLQRNHIKIWGAAGSIKNSGSADITPVVGLVRDLNVQNLVLNSNEVSEVFTVPLKELIKPNNLHYTQFRRRYSVPVFTVQPYRIWGLTAYITFNFLNCLLPPEANWHKHKSRVKYISPYKPIV